MPFLATRLTRIKPSPTLEVTKRANALKAEGKDVIILSAGEPDFDTPLFVKKGAVQAIDDGQTKYTAIDGILPLKRAIQNKFERENGIAYDLDEIIVSCGAKHILFNALLATVEEGDEVLLPAPFWPSYYDMVLLMAGTPTVVPCPTLKLTPDLLEAYITPQTKWLFLNSPSNPSGEVYSSEELKSLAIVLRNHPHVHVLCDDIYEHILFGSTPFSTMAQVSPDLKDRILTVNGVSKTYAMTGWRIGYAGGPKTLIKAMTTLQSQSTSNAPSISQWAATQALTGDQSCLKDFRELFQRRRDLIVPLLNEIPGLTCRTPEGAFYVYPHCGGLLGKITPQGTILKTDMDVATYFLDAALVAVVPGTAFGLSPYFRISYADRDDLLVEACQRLKKAAQDLRDAT